MKKNLYSLKEALMEVFDEHGMKKKMLSLKSKDLWREIMGNHINKYTQKVFLKDQILYISLSSPALKQELNFSKEKIIERFNEKLERNFIIDIRFI